VLPAKQDVTPVPLRWKIKQTGAQVLDLGTGVEDSVHELVQAIKLADHFREGGVTTIACGAGQRRPNLGTACKDPTTNLLNLIHERFDGVQGFIGLVKAEVTRAHNQRIICSFAQDFYEFETRAGSCNRAARPRATSISTTKPSKGRVMEPVSGALSESMPRMKTMPDI
jgi:hypothetical protein